jgi:hypothetical protein
MSNYAIQRSVRFASRRRREGAPWAVIARETGVDDRKLQRWRSRAQRSAPVPVLRPVEVVPKPDVEPSGTRGRPRSPATSSHRKP